MTFARRVHCLKRAAWRVVGCASRYPVADAPGSPGRVLLTFDDGPHPEHTPAVLDRLAAFGLTAAFFLVGNRVTDPALVRRIADAGHQLGNHTFSHALPRRGSLDGADVARCQAVVPAATLFRPPFGRLTPGLWLAARRHGLRVLNWSLDSGDWRCRGAADAAACAAEVVAAARPGDVILFHDDHPWVVPVLDAALPALAAR